MKYKQFLIIFVLCVIGLYIRTQAILWDHGHSLHPDERAIAMFASNLSMPGSIDEFFSPESTLNPHFFAYGSLPLYLLKILSIVAVYISPEFQDFTYQLIIGRYISAFADIGTLILVFLIAQLLFSRKVATAAAGIYTVSVFPIQTAHFYAVDTLLTFFMTLTLYMVIKFFTTTNRKYILLTGISLGLALSTKISAAPILIPVGVLLLLTSIKSLLLHDITKATSLNNIWQLAQNSCILIGSAFITLAISQPYVLIDFQSFLSDTTAQSAMTESAFTFPYTLQYVGKVPYLHELENIFLWGLGPVISTLTLIGLFWLVRYSLHLLPSRQSIPHISIVLFVIVFFTIVGSFAVGWMRYMLPLYPYFALLSGIAIVCIVLPFLKKIPFFSVKISLAVIFLLSILFWPATFLQIYSQPHSRVTASHWIHTNIQPGSTLGVEHWDDRLPLFESEKFIFIEYALYEPDTEEKWQQMEDNLEQTDYIILASNRLYTPLQKLTNCEELPQGRCYKQTAAYYQLLFSEQLGFEKVAEFTNYPTIPFLNIEINDQSADESFTVYDHPKVIIFKRNNLHNATL